MNKDKLISEYQKRLDYLRSEGGRFDYGSSSPRRQSALDKEENMIETFIEELKELS
jgi:hypothetical protein